MSDIPLKASGTPTTLTITKTKHLEDRQTIPDVKAHEERIDLPARDLPVTLRGVDGAERCGQLILRAGATWELTIG